MSFKRDQKFFDLYSLTIGVLALVMVGLFVLAFNMSNLTQGVFTAESAEYQAAVAGRLKPFGEVYLSGDEVDASAPQVSQIETPEPVETALSGPQVYNEACNICHGAGVGGAPMLSDSANWAPRIAQGNDVLYQHAIEGFTGSAGFMPAKGARADLSDQEVTDAVDYMLSQVP